MKKNIKLNRGVGLLLIAASLVSCEKLLEIDPAKNEQPSEVVFSSEVMAKSVLSGAYSLLTTTQTYTNYMTLINGMSAEEVKYMSTAQFTDIMTNKYDPISTSSLSTLWSESYASIYRFNSIIEGLEGNTNISAETVAQMIGEAKTMRAYCFFNLVNMFGDVPLVLTTNVDVSAFMPRTASTAVYEQIIKDLEEAKVVLGEAYVTNNGVTGRQQVNKAAATALLARVYLHTGNYAEALSNASEVIGRTGLYELLDSDHLADIFLKDSRESILQMGSYLNATSGYTYEGATFIPTASATTANYSITESLLESFEEGDLRRSAWVLDLNLGGVNTYQPYKYRNSSIATATASGRIEAPTILRLAEQYLIRAEARLKTGDTDGARADINVIRDRAGLDDLASNADLEEAILQERRIELFCERGDRWFSLKRTGTVDAVMSALRPATWQSYAQWYPIPQGARDTNPNLTQNEGYVQ